MDIVIQLLLWLHLLGLVMGGGGLLGAALLSRVIAGTPTEQRSSLFSLDGKLATTSRAGLVVLIVTGPLMLWLEYGGAPPVPAWFTVKMVLVVIVIIGVVVSGIASKRARKGDAGASRNAVRARAITGVALILTVLAAVFAFN